MYKEKNMGGKDWIPHPDAEFDAFFKKYSQGVGVYTSGDVLAKDEAGEEGKDVLRAFNAQYVLYAREVTDAQRRDIGCPVHSPNRSPISRPFAQPEADILYPGRHLLALAKIRSVAGTMSDEEAKAEFGVRMDPRPLTGNDLPHSLFTHRKKYIFDFDGESGNTVYFCLRYENQKGGKDGEGPFGPMMSAIIP
jgi:hypothetical protein